jgi:hypothetical protein
MDLWIGLRKSADSLILGVTLSTMSPIHQSPNPGIQIQTEKSSLETNPEACQAIISL